VADRQPTARVRSGSKGIPGDRPEPVRIKLLGGFSVSVGDRTIQHSEWRLRKAASLVKLLALAPGHRLHREQAMDLLWADSGRKTASNNLRTTLHAARKTLDPARGSRYLASEDESLVLCPESDLWVDVETFEEAARTTRSTRVCQHATLSGLRLSACQPSSRVIGAIRGLGESEEYSRATERGH
jgi:DNA-binding SARP family transcriptional activator